MYQLIYVLIFILILTGCNPPILEGNYKSLTCDQIATPLSEFVHSFEYLEEEGLSFHLGVSKDPIEALHEFEIELQFNHAIPGNSEIDLLFDSGWLADSQVSGSVLVNEEKLTITVYLGTGVCVNETGHGEIFRLTISTPGTELRFNQTNYLLLEAAGPIIQIEDITG